MFQIHGLSGKFFKQGRPKSMEIYIGVEGAKVYITDNCQREYNINASAVPGDQTLRSKRTAITPIKSRTKRATIATKCYHWASILDTSR